MSASLVGSEMCIRDRGTRANMRAKRRDRAAVAVPFWTARPSETIAMAVSYTHLTLPTICSV
eukprot:8046126-Alexandrium_andersonii.AAC.1